MKRKITSILAGLLLGISFTVNAGPVEDRKALIDFYKEEALPNIKFEDYIYGALAMNPDIMAFPPFAMDVDKGQKEWEKPFKNGKHFSSCFPDGGNNVAGNYPYFDDVAGRVVTFENAINACLNKNGEKELEYGDSEMGLLTSYAKSLSNGMKVNVKVEGAAAIAAYEKGKAYYYSRRGQLNFSCASCHIDNAGNFLRSDQLSMLTGQATHWPEFRAGTDVVTLQKRFIQCNQNVREKALKADSEDYNDLEYFMTYMSNGLPMQTPVFRK
jgi:sulfur-oxidizing protein SoxA